MKRFRIDYGVFEMLLTPIINPSLKLSRWQTLKLKRAFEDYLVAFNNERLLDIPKSRVDVFINLPHPLKINGFSSETVLHFIEFSKTYQLK